MENFSWKNIGEKVEKFYWKKVTIQSKLGVGATVANRLIQIEKIWMKTHEFSETFQLQNNFPTKNFQT